MQHGVLVLEENAGVEEWRSGGVLVRRGCPSPHHPITPSLHHSTTPSLHHSITPLLHYSITPLLHYSITPLLRYSITPLLHYSVLLPRETSPSGVRYFERLSVERNVFASRRALAHRCF
jgi:hypothetical protein